MLFSSCTFYWFQTVCGMKYRMEVDRVSTKQLLIVTSEPPRPPSHEGEGGGRSDAIGQRMATVLPLGIGLSVEKDRQWASQEHPVSQEYGCRTAEHAQVCCLPTGCAKRTWHCAEAQCHQWAGIAVMAQDINSCLECMVMFSLSFSKDPNVCR